MLPPLLRVELMRASRRSLMRRLRVAYVVLLLMALLWSYANTIGFKQRPSENNVARFGEHFTISFFTIQFVVILSLVPVLIWGSVAEERQRRTLDFLLSSPMATWVIVFCKLLSRLVMTFDILLAGLPVILVASLLGGADEELILLGYLGSVMTVLSVACFAMAMSIRHENVTSILVWVWGVVLTTTLFEFCCGSTFSPLTFLRKLFSEERKFLFSLASLFTVAHLDIFALFFLFAATQFRKLAIAKGEKQAIRQEEAIQLPAREMEAETASKVKEIIPANVLPISDTDDPIVWKDRHFPQQLLSNPSTYIMLFLWNALVVLMVVLAYGLIVAQFAVKNSSLEYQVPLAVLAFATCLHVGLRLAPSVVRERQGQTLILLLTLPWSRQELLHSKRKLSWHESRVWLFLLLFVLLTFLKQAILLNVMGAMMLLPTYWYFTHSLGIWLSVVCRTELRAKLCFLFCHIGMAWVPILSVPLVLYDLLQPASSSGHFGSKSFPTAHPYILAFGYGFVGYVLWKWALAQFEKEGRD